ncbi:MAG: ribose 5-phosphate isomerase B [Oscillospiraceae bacterium]|jgi:ribose 5-phosphate isomerase B|nr:ribose 5-phosphate isomerase B [Oscillospiraceae bacterium]
MLALGNDHGGYTLMRYITGVLDELGEAYVWLGSKTDERCDYPDFAAAVARAVVSGEADRGILICGTGIGMSIAANKVPGIRAALCGDLYSAEMTRRHNDANILCMGARVIGDEVARRITEVFLRTEFEGGRHAVRIAKLVP